MSDFKGAWQAETFQACNPYSHLDHHARVEWVPGSLLTDVQENRIAEIGASLLDRGVPLSVYNGVPFRWYSPSELNRFLASEVRTSEGRNLEELEQHLKSALGDAHNQFGFKSARTTKIARAMAGTSEKLACQYRGKPYVSYAYQLEDCYGCLANFISARRINIIKVLLCSGQILVYHPIGKSDLYEFKPHQLYNLRGSDPRNTRYVLLRDLASGLSVSATPKRTGGKRGRPVGSGSYDKDDAPLIAEGVRMMDEGQARSASEAARALVPRAAGSGTPDSKAKRIQRGISAVLNGSEKE